MKVKLLSALTAICLLLGCAVLGTSCVLADFSEVRSPSSTTASTTEALMISESGEDATLAPSVSEMQPSESGEPDPDCVHQAVEIPAVPSTCRLEGSENGTQCKLCGVVLSAPQVIPVSEHSFHESGICLFCGMPQGSVEGLDYLDLYNQTYGYEYLGTMANGAALQRFYRSIDDLARRFHTDPSFCATEVASDKDFDPLVGKVEYEPLGLTKEEAQAVWKTYRDDNPLYYWLSNQVVYTEKTLYLLCSPDYTEGSERLALNRTLYQQISGYLSLIPADATDYQIALMMHDAMIESINYAWASPNVPENADWAHSILGVFNGQGAVCEGFARAYQLLLDFKGVNCLLVTGESRGQGHAWNMIELEGAWYGVDVTWDDGSEDESPYAYFCLSETEFYQSHQKDLPTDSGIDFLYEIPTLADYSLQWADLYLDGIFVGRYRCIDLAFAAMTDPNGDYTVKLPDGSADPLLHHVEQYNVYGAAPAVGSLTLIGAHQILDVDRFGNETYSAVLVYLAQDWELKCDVTLKSLILRSESAVVIKERGHFLVYGGGNYSAVKSNVTVSKS